MSTERMLSELQETPAVLERLLARRPLRLPRSAIHAGMGSSYHAACTARFLGAELRPELASEWWEHLPRERGAPLGVLISQSGRSTETLWCRAGFAAYLAITNDPASPLARDAREVLDLAAGPELGSATKTYAATLCALLRGHELPVETAVARVAAAAGEHEEWGRAAAARAQPLVAASRPGCVVLGSGPDAGTAAQIALILGEACRLSCTPYPFSQYDHGPKEACAGSLVLAILPREAAARGRAERLLERVRAHGAETLAVEAGAAEPDPIAGVFAALQCLNHFVAHLARGLGVGETFVVGAKVTEVAESPKP